MHQPSAVFPWRKSLLIAGLIGLAVIGVADSVLHRDFPAMALDAKGIPWIAYVEHDGKADLLKLARKSSGGIETVSTLSEPGIGHQPAVAVGADGAVWTFWGQVDSRNVVTLRAQRFADGKRGTTTTLAESAGSGSDTFADAGTDHAGRVWVAWQSLRRGQGDIFARWRESVATDVVFR